VLSAVFEYMPDFMSNFIIVHIVDELMWKFYRY